MTLTGPAVNLSRRSLPPSLSLADPTCAGPGERPVVSGSERSPVSFGVLSPEAVSTPGRTVGVVRECRQAPEQTHQGRQQEPQCEGGLPLREQQERMFDLPSTPVLPNHPQTP